jgi:hypothetical protein
MKTKRESSEYFLCSVREEQVAVMSLDSCDLGEKLIRVHAILKCDFGYEYFFEVFDKSEKKTYQKY